MTIFHCEYEVPHMSIFTGEKMSLVIAIPGSQYPNTFLPIPNPETGGIPIPEFQDYKKCVK